MKLNQLNTQQWYYDHKWKWYVQYQHKREEYYIFFNTEGNMVEYNKGEVLNDLICLNEKELKILLLSLVN